MVSGTNIDSSFPSDQFSLGYKTTYGFDKIVNEGRIFIFFV